MYPLVFRKKHMKACLNVILGIVKIEKLQKKVCPLVFRKKHMKAHLNVILGIIKIEKADN